MNVYLYEGMDRENARTPINGSQPLILDWNYTVNYKSGMLLIAYPEKDKETEFEFQYWEAQYVYINYTLVAEQEEKQRQKELFELQQIRSGQIANVYLFTIVVVLVVIIATSIYRIQERRKMMKVQADEKIRKQKERESKEIYFEPGDVQDGDQFNNDKEDRLEWERIVKEVAEAKAEEER